MKKKILIYTMIMTKGGTEQLITNLANEFIKDYEITIVTNINCPCEYKLNSKIKYICLDKKNKKNEQFFSKIFTKFSLARSKKLKQVITKEQPNLILAVLPEPTIRALSLKKFFPQIPIIISIRNHPKKEYNFPFLKLIRNYYYKNADKIIIQNQSYSKYLKQQVQEKIEVIPNFLSPEFITDEKNTKKEKVIITVSRLEKQKNISLLIDSFANLNPKFSSYKLYICGEGSLKNKLQKQVKRLNLEDRVFLKGRVASAKEELKKASLFVLPSNYEGMPNILLEAMSLSLPVIATLSTETIQTIIKNDINGIIIPKNNKKKLTEKMEFLLSHPDIAEKMGQEAKKVKVIYHKNNVIDKWYAVLEKYL